METGVMPEITEEDKPRSVREIIEDAAEENAKAGGKLDGIRVGSANEA